MHRKLQLPWQNSIQRIGKQRDSDRGPRIRNTDKHTGWCAFVSFSHIPLKRDNGLIISPAIEGGSVQMHLLSSLLGGARALKTHFNEIWRELLATNQCIIDNRDLCADYNDCYGWWSECAEYFQEYPLYLAIHNHLYLTLSWFSIDDSFFDNICQLVPW